MEQLVDLPAIERLSDRTLRILGQNPGKFTLQGTNTYLLGLHAPYVLFDTGEGKEGYVPLLEEALARAPGEAGSTGAQLVSDIVLSHKHRDHHGGLPSVLALLATLNSPTPRIWKHALPPGPPDATLSHTLSLLPPGVHLQELQDGQVLNAPGTTLRVLHTPGHTADSICLHVAEEDALLTADTVLGQGTTVFEDLSAYLLSLQRLLERFPSSERVYPGHGPVVREGQKHVRQYIAHRLEREAQVLRVLRDKGGRATAREVVRVLYRAYPESLWPAAERGVGLHLDKLEGEGKVRRLLGPAAEGGEEWELVRP
ncbi:Metallo-hydrolase/oxidoreductase [Calocera cornea HHB12733]|uniref:Metallo-hydrolase/oxidoreductase n=1 Tax=Calocera cornea HHB12733 TaxID=1353952 RepID=A0A165HTU7_9BASI|nr:Metallo-hydrolase/oxidoreductase [Calocera cornea HHB12733]